MTDQSKAFLVRVGQVLHARIGRIVKTLGVTQQNYLEAAILNQLEKDEREHKIPSTNDAGDRTTTDRETDPHRNDNHRPESRLEQDPQHGTTVDAPS
jgi:hypothetical protein